MLPCPAPRPPSRPRFPLPPGACDTHAHVFGPASRFPYAADRSYTPPDAPLEKYLAMLDTLGFARGVLVQGSAHGSDNSAMLDALSRQGGRLRGVAVADASVPPTELRRWHALGVRGLRFNHFFRGGQLHYRGGVPLDAARVLAPVMHELGWHLQLWIDIKDLPDTMPILQTIGLPVVIDHMGRSDASAGIGTPGFASLLRFLGDWRLLGQALRRASYQPRAAGLSGRAAVSHRAGRGEPGPSGLGRRLAASAHGRGDAGRGPSPRPVHGMDAGYGEPAAHSRGQSAAAV